MTRLTNQIRDAIIDAALAKAGITARKRQLAEDRTAFAYACRERSLGGPEGVTKLKLLEQRRKDLEKDYRALLNHRAPSFFGSRTNKMSVNLAGKNLRVTFSECEHFREPFAVEAGDPLDLEFTRMENEEAEIGKQWDEVHGAVKAVVYKVGTVKRLLDIWPEAKELIPETLPEAKPQLPAVQVADLNKLVGLPSDDAKPAN